MAQGRLLADAIWPAFNIETMHSRAWSRCFPEDFRHDHYRQIVHVVLLHATASTLCVLGELREEIADAFQIDDKTVAARIKSMEVGGLVNLAKDSMDRRRTLVTPTTSLVDAFTRYSDYLIDIQAIFSEQIDKRNRISRVREPLKEISFDLLGHVKETKGAPSPEVETVPVAMPTIVEASKARK